MAVDASLRADVLSGRRIAVSGAVLVLGPADGWRGVLPGQRVRLDGRLQPPLAGDLLTAMLSGPTRPAAARPAAALAARGRRGPRRPAAGRGRAAAVPRGLLPGLVDGDTSELDPVLAEPVSDRRPDPSGGGQRHELRIVVGAVALLLRRLRASPRDVAVVGAVVLVGFVIVARPSPSVLRAAVMAGDRAGRTGHRASAAALPALAATILVLLLWQPELAADLGFAMSVSATAGAAADRPGLGRRRCGAGGAGRAGRGARGGRGGPPGHRAADRGDQRPDQPGRDPGERARRTGGRGRRPCSACGRAALGAVAAGRRCCSPQLAGWPCRWLVWVAEYFGHLPGASLPWPSGVRRRACCWPRRWRGCGGCAADRRPRRCSPPRWWSRCWCRSRCAAGVAAGHRRVGCSSPATSVRVTRWCCTPGRTAAVVIDAGPDPVAVDRCLRELGVTRCRCWC